MTRLEFEFNVTRETVVKHADRKCVAVRSADVLRDRLRKSKEEHEGSPGQQGGQ